MLRNCDTVFNALSVGFDPVTMDLLLTFFSRFNRR